MRKITAFVSVTLDGVMQAPGRPDEDPRGDFQYGGWAAPYADEVMGGVAGESMATTGGILLGQRTYQDFYNYWPKQTDNPFTEVLNNTQKYVASTTLHEPLPWSNSTLLQGDAAQAVATLKEQPGKDLVILGSGQLVQSLMRHNLIDEYMLLIHPLVLGSGRRLFAEGVPFVALQLVDTKIATTGVIIATYQLAETTGRGPAEHLRVPVSRGEPTDGRSHEFTRGLYGWITHTDLSSTDPVATREWCSKVLGWTFQPPFPTPGGDYHLFAYAETGGGGIRQTAPEEPPGSTPSVHVEDTQAAFDAALRAGAEPVSPPTKIMEGVCTALVRAPGGVLIGFSGPTD